jgi:hypothetical protein
MIELIKIENYAIHFALLLLGFMICHFSLRQLKPGQQKPLSLPPGPKGWPLVGSVFEMNKDQEWLKYFAWSRIYGMHSITAFLSQAVYTI